MTSVGQSEARADAGGPGLELAVFAGSDFAFEVGWKGGGMLIHVGEVTGESAQVGDTFSGSRARKARGKLLCDILCES